VLERLELPIRCNSLPAFLGSLIAQFVVTNKEANRDTMATLFLTCGLPASGKTTTAKALAHEHSAIKLTADEWLRSIHPDLPGDELDRLRPAVEQLQWELAERILQIGCNVVLDWGLWAREERDHFRLRARELGANVVLVVADTPVEEIRRRIDQRNANRAAGEFHISALDLERAFGFWQPPGPDELALFDPPPR
jgi:predicted kinase